MFAKLTKDRTYIIAEIGGNFINYYEAVKLVNAAAECGVDAIKLQTYRAETIASKQAVFDMENTGVVSQYELFKKYEIDEELHRKVFDYASSRQLDWFSTPSHESDVDLLEKLNVGAYKIGSDDAVNIPFLKYVARRKKPIILSTGMCTLDEVRESVEAIKSEGNNRIILLHAITSYPTHPENVNLHAMYSLMKAFPELPVGYSDHTIGTVACIGAAAMGAAVIEKHFTCDKHAEGPDHMLSADVPEMMTIVSGIRLIERMKGDGIKRPAASEKTTRINNRKSIILVRSMKKGESIKSDDLAIKRPGHGIQPKYIEQLTGRILARDMQADSVLDWGDLK